MDRVEKIQAAIEYIEGHLTQKLELDEIAAAVHYSRYYFHRMFSETIGLTIHDYSQRRRLTEAARMLAFSDKPILEIALLAGYESQQSFTAIFSAMYKQTPHQFRVCEKFYPLQLKLRLQGSYPLLNRRQVRPWQVEFACEEDILCWMELVRLVIGGFPHLDEEQYIQTLHERIRTGQAFILKDGGSAIGIMLFSSETGRIDFLGIHPLYRKRGIQRAFLDSVLGGPIGGKEISITTYREGDKADTGQRREIIALGFEEAELLVEFGYPTQRFVFSREVHHA